MKYKKRVITLMSLIMIMVTLNLLTGCASDSLGSPCSNYGTYCDKTPINSWNNESN